MKIEIKNVKYAAFASEETSCFNATLYIDGVKFGTVSNEGRGGCNRYSDRAVEVKINEYAKTLPKIKAYGVEITPDADTLIGDLLDEFLKLKDLKKACAKKTLFRKAGETYGDGEYSIVKAPYDAKVKAYIVGKYGKDTEIVNELFA